MADPYYRYAERPTTRPPLTLKKIDYIWASRLWIESLYGVADIECDANGSGGSDHCLYHGVFQWPN